MRDKSSEACIDGIEFLLSNLPSTQRQPLLIRHIQSDAGSELQSATFRNGVGKTNVISHQLPKDTKNKKV